MRLHGAAAFAGLFTLGVLAGTHIPRGWRISAPHAGSKERRHAATPRDDHAATPSPPRRWVSQRGTGLALCAMAGVLVLTGYLLYYFAPEAWRPALGWTHAGVGVAMLALVLFHRRARSRHSHARH
jgi:hypothetical protein